MENTERRLKTKSEVVEKHKNSLDRTFLNVLVDRQSKEGLDILAIEMGRTRVSLVQEALQDLLVKYEDLLFEEAPENPQYKQFHLEPNG